MEAAMTAVLLRLGQVEQATGLKKSAIYAKIKGREFPAAVRLGSRSVAWRSDEIQAWIDGLPKRAGMTAKEKPHDLGRDQRQEQRNQLECRDIIQIINRSCNGKARSEAVKLAGGRPRNASPFLSRKRLFSVYSALSSMSKDTRRAAA